MKQRPLLTASLLLAMPGALFAKAPTSKIIIEARRPIALVVVTNPKVLKNFRVWAGPRASRSLWIGLKERSPPHRGDSDVTRNRYYMAVAPRQDRLIYVAFYAFDCLAHQGYVYLPGKTDEEYRLNTSTILYGVEGSWFHAWKLWDHLAQRFIRGAAIQPRSKELVQMSLTLAGMSGIKD